MVNNIIAHDVRPPGSDVRVAARPRAETPLVVAGVRPEPPETRVEQAQILEAVSTIEQGTQSLRRALAFSVHEATGRIVVTVTDEETGELIRQIPPQETLEIAARIKEATAGLFLTARA